MIRLAQYAFMAGAFFLFCLLIREYPLIFAGALVVGILIMAAKIKSGVWP